MNSTWFDHMSKKNLGIVCTLPDLTTPFRVTQKLHLFLATNDVYTKRYSQNQGQGVPLAQFLFNGKKCHTTLMEEYFHNTLLAISNCTTNKKQLRLTQFLWKWNKQFLKYLVSGCTLHVSWLLHGPCAFSPEKGTTRITCVCTNIIFFGHVIVFN